MSSSEVIRAPLPPSGPKVMSPRMTYRWVGSHLSISLGRTILCGLTLFFPLDFVSVILVMESRTIASKVPRNQGK